MHSIAYSNSFNLGGTGSAVDSGNIKSTINFTSFSDFVLGNAIGGLNVLPVSWLSFTAALQNNTVQLKWSVSNEFNVNHYIVEHSTDGIHFKFISSMQIQDSNAQQKHYQWLHSMPAAGNNYYRIRQIDNDGQFSYSKIAAVKVVTEGDCTVTPNPSNDIVLVNCSSAIRYVKCYNAQGTLVKQAIGSSTQQRISLKALPAGMYTFKVFTSENNVLTVKVLKQ